MNKKMRGSILGYSACWLSGIMVIIICVLILVFLLLNGLHVISLDFLLQNPQPSLIENLTGGIFTPIIGTILLVVLGIIISTPWALATAIYLAEYAEDDLFTNTLRTGIDILSGVPTIVFGIFGLAIFTHPNLYFFSSIVEGVENAKAFGRSFFVAAIVMSMMVLPFVIKSIEESIRSVPTTYRNASLSLGISKWRTIRKVIIPTAFTGIITGIVLAIGRIAGDTAIVWLCLGGSITLTGVQPWWHPQNWLSTLQNSGATLTTYIYYSSPAGEGNAASKAFGAAVVLIIIVLFLNAVIDYLGRFTRIKEE